jgi:hypothetical protein
VAKVVTSNQDRTINLKAAVRSCINKQRPVQGTEAGIKGLNVIIFTSVYSFICDSKAVIRLATVSIVGRIAQSV